MKLEVINKIDNKKVPLNKKLNKNDNVPYEKQLQ